MLNVGPVSTSIDTSNVNLSTNKTATTTTTNTSSASLKPDTSSGTWMTSSQITSKLSAEAYKPPTSRYETSARPWMTSSQIASKLTEDPYKTSNLSSQDSQQSKQTSGSKLDYLRRQGYEAQSNYGAGLTYSGSSTSTGTHSGSESSSSLESEEPPYTDEYPEDFYMEEELSDNDVAESHVYATESAPPSEMPDIGSKDGEILRQFEENRRELETQKYKLDDAKSKRKQAMVVAGAVGVIAIAAASWLILTRSK